MDGAKYRVFYLDASGEWVWFRDYVDVNEALYDARQFARAKISQLRG